MNMSNTWNIPIIDKKILEHCYKCDADDHIMPKCPLPQNEENNEQSKEVSEDYFRSNNGHGKGGQRNNYC